MSFKEVRDLAEHLKLLGFPKTFPLQALSTSFGSLASFHVVAEVLQWLAGLLEPGTVLTGGVHSEDQRVLLIRSATEFFVTKSAIKLNPRKLYAASAVTAGELQKITRLLIAPIQTEDERDEEEANNYRSLNQVDIGDKMDDLRRARELSSDLTQRGATLYELLAKEMSNREARLAQANRPMELSTVERALKNAISAAQLKLQANKAQLESARVEKNALNSKLQRKRGELERTKQRLEALQKIRPAHMQEFEECEKELKDLFQKYFLRLHVRDALRAQCEQRNKRAAPVESPVMQKANENSMPFIPEGILGNDDDADEDDDEDDELSRSVGLRRGNFGLDSEIPDIRDEDLMAGDYDEQTYKRANRPGSATSRIRPTTGRSRRGNNREDHAKTGRGTGSVLNSRGVRGSGLGGKKNSTYVNPNDEDDSSFGSSDSELDMAEIMGLRGQAQDASSNIGIGASMLSNIGSQMSAAGDDDFDLNSIDDISMSKITGELPLRPKTANKQEHHSDEDF